MKKAIIPAIFLLIVNVTNNYAQEFSFGYDPAGNRSYRLYTAPSFAPEYNVVEMETKMDTTGIADDKANGYKVENENTLPEAGNILIYPNPNGGIFNIILPLKDRATAQITLYDYAGRQVYQTTTSEQRNMVDISQWADGTYIVKIALEGQVVMHRVIKK
ncbi:MAG: T9SS type A sorting domain-containing protein [Bacteroidales bacterium]|nr:T9SS type A sorting domain-containing protein [Bacteroidales bacterium]